MLKMEHSLMDVQQLSPMENILNMTGSNLVSQLGSSESSTAYLISDTSHDNKRENSDLHMDFFDMDCTEFQFLEPLLADNCADVSSLLSSPFNTLTTSTVEKNNSFNNEVVDLCEVPSAYNQTNLCEFEIPSDSPSSVENTIAHHKVKEGQSDSVEDQLQACSTASNVENRIECHPEKKVQNSTAEDQLQSHTAANKYLEMRRKNNIASRRSRKIRKVKDTETTRKLKELEVQNRELLLVAEKLQKQRDALQSYLLKVIAKK